MKKVVIALLLGDCIALLVVSLVNHQLGTEGLEIIKRQLVSCLIGLVLIIVCIGDLDKMMHDIGRQLAHPLLDAIIIVLIGTATAISILIISENPMAPTAALPIGLAALETAWQFGHQKPKRANRIIRDWDNYR